MTRRLTLHVEEHPPESLQQRPAIRFSGYDSFCILMFYKSYSTAARRQAKSLVKGERYG
jgi:hypothetical protein